MPPSASGGFPLQRGSCRVAARSRPVAHDTSFGKREDHDDEDRGVEQQEQPQITLTEYLLHHILGKQ